MDDNSSKSKVKVIFEVKSIDNKTEFPKSDGNGEFDINCKALQETVLYYLRESFRGKNKEIRRIVITNAKEWFIFDAKDFEQLFVKGNRQLVKDFEDFENNQLAITKTGSFYSDIAQPAIDNVKDKLDYVYFSVDNLDVNSSDPAKLKELIDVFKILSPYYLLKKQFPTDSNALNDEFYKELLHIIGLYETDKDENGKKKTKKTIERLPSSERESGSLLENAILQLSYESSSNLFERAIQLVIVWINRILFLKLLEAQLIKWHNGDQNYKFLTPQNLPEYDNLKELFFGVIARRPADRQLSKIDMEKYKDIPYLNSSLFEPTEELSIAELKDNIELPLYKGSVLHSQPKNALEYLLLFLDAYDFGADESTNGLRKQNKTTINASVLGRIFEKINGYKDGAFFTPGTITQYMCKEAIHRAVVQKFNEEKKWNCQTFDDLYNKDLELSEANKIINSIQICDPAVGSGHFLVSALNELIAIKSELGILRLADNPSRRLKNAISIDNDELMVYDGNGDLFVYNPLDAHDTANHTVQKTLFEEKRTIIENCLFGVDINPNSVNICRLRLWIELLKNAYYKSDGTLETLPNIDINIKCGNSLVSKFPVKVGQSIMKDAENEAKSKDFRKRIKEYREAVAVYKNESNKENKRKVEQLIASIKSKIRSDVQLDLFDEQLNAKMESEGIYKNSMEWILEFPEVLDDEGRFQGFDVVIGNPPYISSEDQETDIKLKNQRSHLSSSKQYHTLIDKWDMYIPFIELGLEKLCKLRACFSMIVPYPYTHRKYAKLSRRMMTDDYLLFGLADFKGIKIFSDATVDNCILFALKTTTEGKTTIYKGEKDMKVHDSFCVPNTHLIQDTNTLVWNLSKENRNSSCHTTMHILGDFCYISKGMVLNSDEKKAKGLFKKEDLISESKDEIHCKTYIEAKDLEKWNIKRIRYLEYGTERCPEKLSRPTFEELYNRPKILTNKIGEIYAVIDRQNIMCDQTNRICILWKDLRGVENQSITNSVKRYSKLSRDEMEKLSETIDLRYLLGVINSKYASVLLSNIRGIGNIDVNPEYIRKIPIPSITPVQQQPIIDLVDQIIAAKQNDPNTDTTAWEQQIDLQLYHLYGLTYDEVLVVDPETAITKEEYEA